MAVEFRLLGDIAVQVDGRPVDLGPAKQRSVLAALLVDAPRTVSIAQLIGRVWAERMPQQVRTTLYGYVCHLRKALEPAGDDASILTRSSGGYAVEVDQLAVDVHRFGALVRQARVAEDPSRRAQLFEEALELWQGEPCADCDTPWFGTLREGLLRERFAAALDFNDAQLRLGLHGMLLPQLSSLAQGHPLDERAAGQLMLALYRSGRASEALHRYESLRRRLAEELGTDPGPELRRLHQQILTDAPALATPSPGAASSSKPARLQPSQRNAWTTDPSTAAAEGRDDGDGSAPRDRGGVNGQQLVPRLLPPAPALFVGRDDEMAGACRLLGRMTADPPDSVTAGPVTLLVTGPAGVGKTAFAISAGHALASRFADGQLYADLRAFDAERVEPFTVLGAFLRALGVRGGAVPPDLTGRVHLYRTLLAQRRTLVVLDNAADAQQVNDLMPSGAHCAAVITSRTTLPDLNGHRLPLGVLDTETGLALLQEMIGADRTLAESDAARAIVSTCQGLPLAVWVAGARLAARPHWPLGKVARALADEQRKLDELAVGHIAVRASLELTYQGMTPTNRHALRMLALLPAPDFAAWALAALLDLDLHHAEAVLDDLVEVHVVEAGSTGLSGMRYRLHDLVRLLGRERAEREVPPQHRAAALSRLLGASLYLADLAADSLSVDFQGISQTGLASWRLSAADTAQVLADPQAWFNDERQPLIAVADQALDRDEITSAAALATTLTTLFQIGSHFDDWERLQGRALKAALRGGHQRSATQLHRCLGELTTILDRYPEALDHFEQALKLADGEDPAYLASATAGLAYVHRLLGQYASATSHFERAAELARMSGNINCLVYATNGIGVIELEQGRVEAAVERFSQCLRASRDAGYRPGEAQALRCLGQSHRANGAYPAAADCFRQAASISENLGDRLTATHATCWLGDVLVRQGEQRQGRRLLARTLWTYREFGNLWGEAATLYALAEAQLAAGRVTLACRRAEAAADLWRKIGSRTWLAVGLDTLAKAHTLAGNVMAATRVRQEAAEIRRELEATWMD
ncbi:AfsR/SARP family transcriptional regulator [Streptomyces sp. HD]|uniref:AfsR/SARP family transcriptional regulator n=1 Tax=Streptomyces sp. HD TaxID=3020892 RepID=UPI00232AA470|nr:BTAD domain-containing putative transcriptional regulator [Streptomyces sp. HD]MDC0771584.1 BTAD domain-containing putative transcriptional regulator [Streptomyces sp. HD]